MARKRSGGYRAPGDYDPRRGRKPGARGTKFGDSTNPGSKRPKASETRDVSELRDPARGDAARRDAALPPLATLPAPLESRRTRPEDVAGLGFGDLGLGGNIVRALAELGAEDPFPIQAATIPDALAGHHVLGRGRTGSGKTIAFGAALVERLLRLKAEGAFPDEAPRRVADTLAEFGDVRGRLIHGAHDGEFHGRTYLM